MFVSVKVQEQALNAYNKRREKKILVIKRQKIEKFLSFIAYTLFWVFSVLCAYNLGAQCQALW